MSNVKYVYDLMARFPLETTFIFIKRGKKIDRSKIVGTDEIKDFNVLTTHEVVIVLK